MKDAWQVFFSNAPMWPFGEHVLSYPAQGGPVPILNCSAVQQGPSGLIELTVLDEASKRELTFLVPAQNILTAVRLRDRPELGFGPPLLASLAQSVAPAHQGQ